MENVLVLFVWSEHLSTREVLFVDDAPFGTDLSHLVDVLEEHGFPKLSILLTELLSDGDAQAMVKDDQLRFCFVFWVWSHEEVAWVWVTVYEACDKDLLSKCSDDFLDNCVLVVAILRHEFFIGYLDAVDPFRHQYSWTSKFVTYVWDTDILLFEALESPVSYLCVFSLQPKINLFS